MTGSVPELSQGVVAVIVLPVVGLSSARVAALAALLDDDECERNRAYSRPAVRQRDAVCRGLLRELLSRYLGIAPGDIALDRSEHGKPRLLNVHSDLAFNYSHSRDHVAYAFCHGADIGVDIEFTGRRASALGVSRGYFSQQEYQALASLSPDEQQQRFFHLWTLKEAYLKARGEGVFVGLDHFRFELGAGEAPEVEIHFAAGVDDFPQHWQFHSMTFASGYCLGLALRRAGRPAYKLELMQPGV